MATGSIFYKDNTMVIRCDELADLNGVYQNSATVTLESLVVESTGVAVSGVTVPLAMSYVASSDGRYDGSIPVAAAMVVGTSYLATVKAVSGGNTNQWEERVKCKLRRG